jgi:hypothetical protein
VLFHPCMWSATIVAVYIIRIAGGLAIFSGTGLSHRLCL